MALADQIKDLEKKANEAKTRITGGIAFLKDAKKVAGAGLNDKKKMSGFIANIGDALGRAKDARDKILQGKDYKAITNAKDPIKINFIKVNDLLTKQVQAEFAKLRDAAVKLEAAPKPVPPKRPSNINSISDWSKLMTDKVFGPKILTYCKSSHFEETLKFLSVMKQGKKDKSTYDVFIKAGSKQEINIAQSLRKQFDEINKAAKPDWSKAPWDAATKEMIRLFNDNIIKDMPI